MIALVVIINQAAIAFNVKLLALLVKLQQAIAYLAPELIEH